MERLDGIRDRRGTSGDLRATSTRTSRGLIGAGVRGLVELSSESSSVSVEGLEV